MPPALVGSKDERLVVAVVQMGNHHRAAKAAAVGIADKLRLSGGDGKRVRNSVKGRVLVVPERRPVNGIGAAFADYRDLAGLAKLSAIQRAIGSQFRNRLGRWEGITNGCISSPCVLDGDAIDRNLRHKRQATLQRKGGVVCLNARQSAYDLQCARSGRAGPGIHWKS